MEKEKKLTPMLRQFLDVKNKHRDKLILFRMGDFYETFFEDAVQASKILGITLTSRNKNDDESVPLAGFPYHALDTYLDKLIKNGVKVAICEQVEDPKLAKGLVKREIVQIITPGSILDEKLISGKENNFLASIYHHSKFKKYGLAFLDVSTGDFIHTEINKELLMGELSRTTPSEIVVIEEELKKEVEDFRLENNPAVTLFTESFFDFREAEQILKQHFNLTTLEGFGSKSQPLGLAAAGLALAYLKFLKNDNLKHISSLRRYSVDDFMQIDEVSIRNLELFRSMRYGSRFGSLISVLDETKTPMGARLLKNWLIHPLMEEDKIQNRLKIVEAFRNQMPYTDEIRIILDKIGDLSRIISKVGAMRVNARDLITLSNYLSTAPEIKNLLLNFTEQRILAIADNIMNYDDVIDLIDRTVAENPPLTITEGNIINDGYNAELDELRQISRQGKSWIARLESKEREKTGIPSLKVSFNKVFGYYIEVTKTHQDKVPEEYIRKQTLVNCERYISQELKEFEAKVLGAEDRIKSLEYELFIQLREMLYEKVELLQQYVQEIALIDVYSNFAFIAYHRNYTKPKFNSDGRLFLQNSRHPVIERLLENEEFIPNDVDLDDD
ncbi:MAG: DNA mismatch repair protein MutS, partial [Candidatus Cloacimonetes bacterium]|nr:DNA mismatch repair protein MutS [Candidatus Cloacimonadota bacterium]